MNPRPAWREPMVWLTFGLPAASVVAGILLVVTAVRAGGADDVDSTVQRRAQVQLTDLGPDEAARQMRVSALVRIDAGGVEVLPVSGPVHRHQSLALTLTHPTDERLDRHLVLQPTTNGWRADVGVAAAHDWLLRLAPPDAHWRVVGRLAAGTSVARVGPALAPD